MESDVYLGDHFEKPKQKEENHFKMVKLGAFVVNRSACSLRFIPRGTGERGTGERGIGERGPSDQAHIERYVWRKRVGGY